ncbi:Multidrug resistance protein (function not yet clear) [Staphylococcus aureus]|nr:Multidrug resistance protein (function not yet clear) [Staphylococcus aureus]
MLKQGDKLDKGDKVAIVTVQGQDGETKDMDLKMPQKGTIAKLDVWKVQWCKLVTQSLMHTI